MQRTPLTAKKARYTCRWPVLSLKNTEKACRLPVLSSENARLIRRLPFVTVALFPDDVPRPPLYLLIYPPDIFCDDPQRKEGYPREE